MDTGIHLLTKLDEIQKTLTLEEKEKRIEALEEANSCSEVVCNYAFWNCGCFGE